MKNHFRVDFQRFWMDLELQNTLKIILKFPNRRSFKRLEPVAKLMCVVTFCLCRSVDRSSLGSISHKQLWLLDLLFCYSCFTLATHIFFVSSENRWAECQWKRIKRSTFDINHIDSLVRGSLCGRGIGLVSCAASGSPPYLLFMSLKWYKIYSFCPISFFLRLLSCTIV